MKRRFWYHCTPDFSGDSFTAKRRPPMLRMESEPLTPRICVCPNASACFAAVLFPMHRPVFVYRTEYKRRTVPPSGVWDHIITRERWLIPPTRLVLVDVVTPRNVDRIASMVTLYHRITKQKSDWRLRVQQYYLAMTVLPRHTPTSEYRRIERTRRAFELETDPEEWILDRCVQHENGPGSAIIRT